VSQRLIATVERSGLLTHIVTTEGVSCSFGDCIWFPVFDADACPPRKWQTSPTLTFMCLRPEVTRPATLPKVGDGSPTARSRSIFGMSLTAHLLAGKTQSKKIRARKRDFEGDFPRGEQYLLCEYAMLCRAIGALASKNETAGFELSIPCGGLCSS